MLVLIAGLVGFSAGIAMQRFLFIFSSEQIAPTICDCCIWKKENEWRWDEKSRR